MGKQAGCATGTAGGRAHLTPGAVSIHSWLRPGRGSGKVTPDRSLRYSVCRGLQGGEDHMAAHGPCKGRAGGGRLAHGRHGAAWPETQREAAHLSSSCPSSLSARGTHISAPTPW